MKPHRHLIDDEMVKKRKGRAVTEALSSCRAFIEDTTAAFTFLDLVFSSDNSNRTITHF
jgi:hypothetical protein